MKNIITIGAFGLKKWLTYSYHIPVSSMVTDKQSTMYSEILRYHNIALYKKCYGKCLTGLSILAECASEGGCGFDSCQVGNILLSRLIMKYFLWSFSPFHWFKKGSLSVSDERMCIILVNPLEDYACPVNMGFGKLTSLDMTPCWMDHKISTQTNSKCPKILYT